jgi:hypothetical protein
MVWVQLVLLLTAWQFAEAAKTSLVRDEQQLIAALRNHAVTDILLSSSITLTAKRWPGTGSALAGLARVLPGAERSFDGAGTPSIVLRRDVRVRGASHVTLDAAWLQQKLALAEGRTLRFEGLLLRRLVTHGDTGSDFIVYSPKAVVSISQCVHEMLICPTDLSTMLTYLRKLPRPADRAHQGEQDISIMDHMECLATPMQQHCQPAGLLMADVALAAGHAPAGAASAPAPAAVVEYTGSYLPCSAYLSPSCVEKYGLASCYDSMLSRLWWQQWLEVHLLDCIIGERPGCLPSPPNPVPSSPCPDPLPQQHGEQQQAAVTAAAAGGSSRSSSSSSSSSNAAVKAALPRQPACGCSKNGHHNKQCCLSAADNWWWCIPSPPPPSPDCLSDATGVAAALLGGYLLHNWLRPCADAAADAAAGKGAGDNPLADRWWKGSSSRWVLGHGGT